MSDGFFIIGLAGIMGTILALRCGWLAVHEKDMLERVLCAGLSFLGLVAAIPLWASAVVLVSGGLERFGGFGIEIQADGPVVITFLAGMAILTVIVAVRRIRAKAQGRT